MVESTDKNGERFESSDSIRSARSLKYVQTFDVPEAVTLAHGGELPSVTVAYETYGQLNAGRDNAVLICHALSGDSHVARHDDSDDPGWWDIVVGPGKCIDTDKFFVICPNVLGGCRGTTGPNSIDPHTGVVYGREFPTITIGDIVEVQRLLIDALGIDALLAVVGGSMGGQMVLHWAAHHADRVRGAVAIATSAKLSSQALAFDVLGRDAILMDPDFRDGQYYQGPGPDVGLAMARMLAHITYLSPESMENKFQADRNRPRDVDTSFEKQFSVGSYLAYQGEKFVERFDANSYLTLSMAMDLFDLGQGEALAEALRPSRCRWLVMSFTSDWLFPPRQSQQLVDALIATDTPVSYGNVASECGHDAFLLPAALDSYGELIRAFLANIDGEPKRGESVVSAEKGQRQTAEKRLDYELIVTMSEPAHSILDLGCGAGELLGMLRQRGHERLVGVELDERAVLACARCGLDVIHADLNEGLASFADKQFDFVVLSRTLQAIQDVERVMDDMLRVGKRCIVTFPNFGYYKLRQMLFERGKAPQAAGILSHNWYNSPNIRFLTIDDFEEFCTQKGILVHRRVTLDTELGKEINDDPNLRADLAIFIISRN